MRRAAALLAVALLGLACGGPDPLPGETGEEPTMTAAAPTTTTSTTAVAPDGLAASIDVNRLFTLEHAMGLGLQNLDDVTRTVVQIQIESNLFETVPLADERVVLTPGLRELVMPVPYGAPICDDPDADVGFTAVVRLEDGTELRVAAPPRSDGTIERMHERECRAVALQERVAVTFGDTWVPDGLAVHGELLLAERAGGPPVELRQLAGSVIFRITAEAPVTDLRVGDGTGSTSLPVTIDVSRCDPHGLAEAKRTYVFVAWFGVEGAESIAVDLVLDGAVRTALEAQLAACLALGGTEAEIPG